jgi:hypothetical protein
MSQRRGPHPHPRHFETWHFLSGENGDSNGRADSNPKLRPLKIEIGVFISDGSSVLGFDMWGSNDDQKELKSQ